MAWLHRASERYKCFQRDYHPCAEDVIRHIYLIIKLFCIPSVFSKLHFIMWVLLISRHRLLETTALFNIYWTHSIEKSKEKSKWWTWLTPSMSRWYLHQAALIAHSLCLCLQITLWKEKEGRPNKCHHPQT